MDITMPEKDGLAALKEIMRGRPQREGRHVLGPGQEAKVVEAIRSGAKDFVVKPFQQDRVIAAIEKALAYEGGVTERSGCSPRGVGRRPAPRFVVG